MVNSKNINCEDNSKEKQFWEEYLSGDLISTTFPNDIKEHILDENLKEQIKFCFSSEAFTGIKKLSTGSDYKLQILLTAALNIILYKYTGSEDIITCCPINKQMKKGKFINTFLPLRCNLKGEMTFKEHLIHVKNVILNVNRNQNYPIRKMLNSMAVPRMGTKFPLFDVMLIVDSIHDRSYVEDIENNVTFIFSSTDREISVTLEYKPSLYGKYYMSCILENMDRVFQIITNSPDIKMRDINILTPKQYNTILSDFNRHKALDVEVKLMKQLFEEQVLRTSENIAISAGDTQITYDELNRRSNQVAAYLLEKGLKSGDVVGIMVEPSAELCMALIGTIKAGGVFLPLDSRYPEERLAFMIKDSEMRFVIAEEHLFNMFKGDVCLIDIRNKEIPLMDADNPNSTQNLEDLSYIIYTSGSTGQPKGVMIKNITVSKTILWRKFEYGFNTEHSVLQLVSYAFDGFIGGLFTPLLSGSKVVLLNSDETKNLSIIKKKIEEKYITHLHGVPLLISTIMEGIPFQEARSVKTITVGGDKVTPMLVKICSERDIELINEYGPTENTIISTIHRNLVDSKKIRIGKPIYDTKIYILDKDDNICPIGVTGELCVSGGRLASGYLNRPELTAEKFVPNPFEKVQIMYRTGDLAKWCEDGNVDFVGRKDYQIKIRGFRIELEEIEVKVLEYPYLKQAVVIDRKYENGVKYLCAYFVSDTKIEVNELKSYLFSKLPEYMIPTCFKQILYMPVTSNGKIDRKSLPTIDISENKDIVFTAPRNEKENEIAKVWRAVLEIKNIGVYDNFFAIGGDSLKAIKAASILSEKFKIAIDDVYKYKNIHDLASHIEYSEGDLVTQIQRVKDEIAAINESNETPDLCAIPNDLKEQQESYLEKIKGYEYVDLGHVSKYKNILLTGATGYVGIYLLKEIVCHLESTVYLLVRGKNENEALERLTSSLAFYFGEDFYIKHSDKIKVLNGDITDTYLGLEEQNYKELANLINCIINSSAYVKHHGHHKDFYAVNVQGTKNLIDFACVGKVKDFNQISTTTICEGNIDGVRTALFTEYDTDIGQKSESLYSQTKLLGEKIVINAGKGLLNTKIFRLGNVTFDSKNGMFQKNIEDNAFYKILKSYIKIGCFPNMEEKVLNFSYVDQVAKSIILLFDKTELNNEVFNIYNPYMVSTSELANLVKEGYSGIEIKTFNEFLDFILKNIHNDELCSYIENILIQLNFSDNESFTRIISLNDKTNYLLDRLGFSWIELDNTAVNKMIGYCEKVNFFEFT